MNIDERLKQHTVDIINELRPQKRLIICLPAIKYVVKVNYNHEN